MIRRIAEHIGSLRLAGRERGGVALIMLVGFMGLAVPMAVASLETSAQLSRNSQVYNSRLTGMYSAGAGIEVAIHQIMSDPTFDDDLAEGSPSKSFDVSPNGDTVTVTVTKIFSQAPLQGQAIVATKTVDPASAPVNATTTYNYSIQIDNEGTGTAEVNQVYDYLPPGFTYLPGSSQLDDGSIADPSITQNAPATCGSVPQELFWNLSPLNVNVAGGADVNLEFEATASLPDGEYINQASVRYDPWWTGPDLDTYTAYAPEVAVTVGTGTPKCGYNLQVLVTTDVQPADPEPGVLTEFAYTVNVENISTTDTIHVCGVENVLPPTFTYKAGSAAEDASNISTAEPILTWDSQDERWTLDWSSQYPLVSIPIGQTRYQKFKTESTPESGVNYYNEPNVTWTKTLLGNGKCKLGGNDGGTMQGGAGGSAGTVVAATLFDVSAVASDGTVQSRVQFYSSSGEIDILSWQEW